MARCSCSLLTLALLLALALDPASPRRRRMLVRRKVPVPASNTTQPSGGRQPRPGRVVRRRLVPASPAPQLLAPAPPLPQHKPFTVNQTVAAKPDAVKRCEQLEYPDHVMTVTLLQSCRCSPSCPGSRAPAPPPPAPTAPATPAMSAPASAAQPQVRRGDNVGQTPQINKLVQGLVPAASACAAW